MPTRDIIVIGTSAGGVAALMDLVKNLPKDFPGTIFIVQHVAASYNSSLPKILSDAGRIKAVHPKDGEAFVKGRIYIAPPDHHLLIETGRILVKKGPKENRFRPSIDALFRSAAYTYQSRVVGVVLSGLLDDGTSGLWSIKRLGGVSVIQDPLNALFPDMPFNAMKEVEVDHVVPVGKIGPLLQKLVTEEVPYKTPSNQGTLEQIKKEVDIAAQQNAFDLGTLQMGQVSPLTCPECHGALVGIQEENRIRYRCHTGHAFSSNALLSLTSEKIESELWNVVRGLEEVVILLESSGQQYDKTGESEVASRFFQKAKEIRQRSENIRESIFSQESLNETYFLKPE